MTKTQALMTKALYLKRFIFAMWISRGTHAGKFTKTCLKNRLNLSLIYDAEHSVILTELQSALRLSPISPSFPHIDAIADQWKISQTILYGRDAILRVRDKWLIFNMVAQLWADVKYHVPTGFGFSPKASGFYPFGDATDLVRGRRWWCGVADSIHSLKSDMPQH